MWGKHKRASKNCDTNERVREQERDSSKDLLIKKNPPFNARKMETEDFFENIKTAKTI